MVLCSSLVSPVSSSKVGTNRFHLVLDLLPSICSMIYDGIYELCTVLNVFTLFLPFCLTFLGYIFLNMFRNSVSGQSSVMNSFHSPLCGPYCVTDNYIHFPCPFKAYFKANSTSHISYQYFFQPVSRNMRTFKNT